MPARRNTKGGPRKAKKSAKKKTAPKKKAKKRAAPAKKAKTRKLKPAAKKAAKPSKHAEESEEIAFLFDRLQAEEDSERAWRKMTDGGESDDADALEEKLDQEPHEREDAERRWKYFGK